MSRVAKNSYVWHGRNNLSHTLSQLKSMAQATRMAEQLELHLHDRQDDWELLSTLDSSDDCEFMSVLFWKICAPYTKVIPKIETFWFEG